MFVTFLLAHFDLVLLDLCQSYSNSFFFFRSPQEGSEVQWNNFLARPARVHRPKDPPAVAVVLIAGGGHYWHLVRRSRFCLLGGGLCCCFFLCVVSVLWKVKQTTHFRRLMLGSQRISGSYCGIQFGNALTLGSHPPHTRTHHTPLAVTPPHTHTTLPRHFPTWVKHWLSPNNVTLLIVLVSNKSLCCVVCVGFVCVSGCVCVCVQTSS